MVFGGVFFSENDCNWLNNLQVIFGKCAQICRKFQFNHKTRRWEPWCRILCLNEMTESWLPESRKNYFLTKDYRYQVSIGSSSDIDLLLEREKNYKQAIENANKAGEGSKARRYGRGLKVRLQFAAILILLQQSIFEISSVLLRLLQNLLRLLHRQMPWNCFKSKTTP